MSTKNKFASAIKSNAPKDIQPVPIAVPEKESGSSPTVSSKAVEQSTWKTPRTRKEKKAVMTYLSRDAHKALKTLAIEQDKTIKELMDEAVTGLFRAYGKTPIN